VALIKGESVKSCGEQIGARANSRHAATQRRSALESS
jgi:hypothetical protein